MTEGGSEAGVLAVLVLLAVGLGASGDGNGSALLVSGTERWMRAPPPMWTPIVSARHRVVLCTVPKAACTAWRQLMRRVAGHSDFNSHSKDPHSPLPHHSGGLSSGLRFLSGLGPAAARGVLLDASYLKAAVVRNPLIRAVSAYRDKCEPALLERGGGGGGGGGGDEGGAGAQSAAEGQTPPVVFPSCQTPFAVFVEHTVSSGCEDRDKHFVPQACFCGLDGPFADRFAVFKMETQQGVLVHRLVEEHGVPRGKFESGWGANGTAGFLRPDNARHGTQAWRHLARYYTSPALFDAVAQAYAIDIGRFGYGEEVGALRRSLFGEGGAGGDGGGGGGPGGRREL